jgi:hypothetical protein
MQRAQHKAVPAERYDDIGIVEVALTVGALQGRHRFLGLPGMARHEVDSA